MKVVLYSIDKEGNKYFDYTNDKEYIEVMNKMQTDFPSIIAIIPMIDIGYYKMEKEENKKLKNKIAMAKYELEREI